MGFVPKDYRYLDDGDRILFIKKETGKCVFFVTKQMLSLASEHMVDHSLAKQDFHTNPLTLAYYVLHKGLCEEDDRPARDPEEKLKISIWYDHAEIPWPYKVDA